MKNYTIIILLCLAIGLVSCYPHRRRSKITLNFIEGTGVAIAADSVIEKYEKEHQKFHLEESKDGTHLGWPNLENKNLSIYCKKYLQHSVPSRTTDSAIGIQIKRILHYKKKNTNITNKIVIVHCKVSRVFPEPQNITIKSKVKQCSYYVTRAPEPNCVYALKYALNMTEYLFTIINKYCDFEDKRLKIKILKQKMTDNFSEVHYKTGQPIAKDEYLLTYELEHHEMFKKEGSEDNYIEWPHARTHTNLDYYCYQYMRECIPSRNPIGVIGGWKTEKISYQKLIINEIIHVRTVTCLAPKSANRCYHMMRAPETNCVYSLLRNGLNRLSPMVIIFKHCDFEDLNDEKIISEEHTIIVPKTDVKEEPTDILKTSQLFPQY